MASSPTCTSFRVEYAGLFTACLDPIVRVPSSLMLKRSTNPPDQGDSVGGLGGATNSQTGPKKPSADSSARRAYIRAHCRVHVLQWSSDR
ncbi:unnamed protein product [Protopolystoma xenopodis]|uniref:Uncharacterized protein n=1 Tax=Protopolystoma xenopodis TaxID=117903 RepID=A0A3S5BUY4_9PLAT|nr:unnamed protein product [Protopolystoma xenopodis]